MNKIIHSHKYNHSCKGPYSVFCLLLCIWWIIPQDVVSCSVKLVSRDRFNLDVKIKFQRTALGWIIMIYFVNDFYNEMVNVKLNNFLYGGKLFTVVVRWVLWLRQHALLSWCHSAWLRIGTSGNTWMRNGYLRIITIIRALYKLKYAHRKYCREQITTRSSLKYIFNSLSIFFNTVKNLISLMPVLSNNIYQFPYRWLKMSALE